MGFMLNNGRLLLAPSGLPAISAACCCDQPEQCCCTRLNKVPFPTLRARVNAPGCAIDGATISMTTTSVSAGECQRWISTGSWSADCNPSTNMGLVFTCPSTGTSCNSYHLSMTPGNSGCAQPAGNTGVVTSSCRCGTGCPNSGFFAIFNGFSLQNRFPGSGCNCCANFSIVIEEVC